MISWRVADVIISFSRDRDDMLLANFQRVRGLDAERKLLPRPAKDCLPNLTPLWANGNFLANRSGVVSGGIYKRDVNVAVCFHFYVNNTPCECIPFLLGWHSLCLVCQFHIRPKSVPSVNLRWRDRLNYGRIQRDR